MIIVLPDDKDGLPKLTKAISGKRIEAIVKSFSEVSIRLPKFELNTDYDLVPIRKKQGLRSVFSDEANLSGISGRPSLKVNAVKHKAAVVVSEEGTVAAAITAVEVGFRSLSNSDPHVQMIFDVECPFLFYNWDSAVYRALFVGEVHKL